MVQRTPSRILLSSYFSGPDKDLFHKFNEELPAHVGGGEVNASFMGTTVTFCSE